MAKIIIPLKNPEHWKWKIHKKGANKIKIKGKIKKWLKKNCTFYVILRAEVPPVVWIADEEEAILFKLTFG